MRGKELLQIELPKGARNAFEKHFSETIREGDCALIARSPRSERPAFVFAGLSMAASRWAYLIYNGDIGRGQYVCHECDRPRCINPAHLWLGTPKQNSADMSAKGRHWRTARMLKRLGASVSATT